MASYKLTSVDPDDLSKAFRELDKNGDGFLSKDEIVEQCIQLTSEEEFIAETYLKKFMDKYDLNEDGKIDYGEFVHWVFKNKRRQK